MLELVTQFTENYLNKKSDRLQKAQTFFTTKAVQSIPLRHRFVIDFFCNSSIAFLHPLSRLAPIKALPQAPTGLCPCTFCYLRSWVLLLCVGDLLGMALPFLTPHSSLKNYALSTFNRFVVPLIPSGTPAVITTRSPFFR